MAFRHRTPDGREYISHRPQLMAREAMVASGHHLASQAGLRVLERGGNAIDAGVAAGLSMSVLQSDMISFLGVAPIIIYLAKERRVVTISGLGRWPRAASLEWFHKNCGGEIPVGVRRAVTPSAPDAWLTALNRYGTKSFAEVAADAILLAERGFPMHHFMHEHIQGSLDAYFRWEDSRPIYFPRGELIPVGQPVYHKDLAETLKRMARAEERARARGRSAGIQAAREEKVPVTVNQMGGLLSLFFTAGPVRDAAGARRANAHRYARYFRRMLAQGVYLPPSPYEAWFLSTGFGPAERSMTLKAHAAALRALSRG